MYGWEISQMLRFRKNDWISFWKKKRTWFFLASQLFVFFLLPPGSFLTSPVFWLFRVTPPFSGKKEKGKVTKKIGNTKELRTRFPSNLSLRPVFQGKFISLPPPKFSTWNLKMMGFSKGISFFQFIFFSFQPLKLQGCSSPAPKICQNFADKKRFNERQLVSKHWNIFRVEMEC